MLLLLECGTVLRIGAQRIEEYRDCDRKTWTRLAMERGTKSLGRDGDRKKLHPSSAIAAAALNFASVCHS